VPRTAHAPDPREPFDGAHNSAQLSTAPVSVTMPSLTWMPISVGDSGLSVYPSDTNFVLVRTPAGASAVFAGLLARGVLVKNVAQPGPLANCLRITVGTAIENERCLRALRAAIDDSRPMAAGGTV
jgi:hypothetical protein